eukprot:338114-Chlamydomonas_euryale.AAC.2
MFHRGGGGGGKEAWRKRPLRMPDLVMRSRRCSGSPVTWRDEAPGGERGSRSRGCVARSWRCVVRSWRCVARPRRCVARPRRCVA